MISERTATLAAADGAEIEARVAVSPAPSAGLVVSHPHPLYGGDMDNPVVIRVVEVATEEGLATLRFNFRGVGRSTGVHDGGRAEQHDVRAARAHLAGLLGEDRPVALAGYSFGSVVTAQVAVGEEGLGGLALIGPPLAMTGDAPFLGLRGFPAPLLIVAGSEDEYCPRPALDALGRALGAPVTVIEGASHFFFGKLYPFGEAVRTWVRQLEPWQAGRRG